MKKALAVMVVAAALLVCGAALADKTKKTTKTTTQKTVGLFTLSPVSGINRNPRNVSINGVIYDEAVWWAWDDFATYDLKKKYDRFEAYAGVDDERGCQGSVRFSFYTDGNFIEDVTVRKSEPAQFVSFSVKNIRSLKIEHANSDCNMAGTLANPKLIIGASAPKKETTTTASVKTSTSAETTEETESGCEGSSNIIVDSKSLETLANNLAQQANDAGLAKNGKVQLAITKFKLVSICKKSVADDVLDDLSTYLLKTKTFKLIEREQLEKAIKELKFNLTGFIEPKKAIELGKMVGAQAILIGSVSDRGTSVMVNARIINTKTGEADIAENVEMKK